MLYREIRSLKPGESMPIIVKRDQRSYKSYFRMPKNLNTKTAVLSFSRKNNSGRIEAECKGNTVTVLTRGVKVFSILLSLDQFDLKKPVKIIVNGVKKISRIIRPDKGTLLKYAAIDLDRTMLFAAEIEIKL